MKRERRWASAARASLAVVGLLGIAALSALGCESGGSSFCAAQCDCQGCGEHATEDCVDDVEDNQRLAEHEGCGAEYSDYTSCYVSEGTCTNSLWVASSCEAKGDALKACSSRAGTIVKGVCEHARDKLVSCGLSGSGVNCAGEGECYARCTAGATCDQLMNPQSGDPYTACVVACSGGGP
jgi:hypothetical protein